MPPSSDNDTQQPPGSPPAAAVHRPHTDADAAADERPPPTALPRERDALLAAADELALDFASRAAEHDLQGSFPHESFEALRAGGWASLPVPRTHGGWGANLRTVVEVSERFAAGDGSTALAMAMHFQTLGHAAEAEHWRPDTLAAVYERAVAGCLVNACATEPELGSPSRGGLPRTTARPVGGGWSITGRKSFASMAPTLDYFVIPAALEEEGELPIGRFLVPRDAGVEVIETWDAMGMRASGSHDVRLDGVVVPEESLLFRQSADPPDPRRVTVNAWFTLTLTGVYLGVASGALNAALDYAMERVPTALGRPIASLEGIQRRLGRADLRLRSARGYLHAVADAWAEAPAAERRERLGEDVVAAKVVGTNAAIDATDQAARVVGGASMRRSSDLERRFRDVRAGIFHPPHDDTAAALLGRRALLRRGWLP